ncbi:MAG: hybrid sensor histidine kinase/response regulator [Desulfuromonadaceae bacterium GWB2_53_15]|nr:MAG: hybrid sensor histidine kinase/response regulator [Desulfuromonadales bacterium GWD2_54_10]OHB33699.1 MAG: hybrid sensor histidine kinase/response regulator [Desulfuromonadaceae bacterium GWB2_53_15]
MTIQQWHNEDSSSTEQQATILIVDDEELIRDLCEKALKQYRILKADSCSEALWLYKNERPDLILSDVMMPGGTGIDLLRRVKEIDPHAVVIIMTGFAEKEIVLNALKEGADDFISKPLNLLQLRTAVEKALVKKRLREELASLKQMDRLKSNFLSLISHKLRTPITSISLFLQNIQRGYCDPNDPLFMQNAQMIYDEASYLGRLVADLLAFSQVMVGNVGLNLEMCDLNDIVTEVLHKSREAQNKPGIELDFDKQKVPLVHIDRSKISFALQQIIDNAYKFSKDEGQISIAFKNSEDKVSIIVYDSGIGIPREEIAKVFEKFYQIDPDNTGQVRGFGLGLFYAREFVRQNGGSISLDSEPGLGTAVTVTLPLQ